MKLKNVIAPKSATIPATMLSLIARGKYLHQTQESSNSRLVSGRLGTNDDFEWHQETQNTETRHLKCSLRELIPTAFLYSKMKSNNSL